MIRAFLLILVTIAGIYFYSCSDPTSGNVANLPPDTYLSLFPDSTIAPGSTLKRINWWGDDPDGLIKGFFISFDSVIGTVLCVLVFPPSFDLTVGRIVCSPDAPLPEFTVVRAATF